MHAGIVRCDATWFCELCKGGRSACASRNHHGHAFNHWAALTFNTSGLMGSGSCESTEESLAFYLGV